MYSFLFDISPVFSQIRVSLRLAERLYANDCEVCYTHTSDSAFTVQLLEQGIGRMIYPADLQWFRPDLTLLDLSLSVRTEVYAWYGIPAIYVTAYDEAAQQETFDGIPLLRLPPSPCRPLSQNVRETDFLDKIQEIRQAKQRTFIIGILEENTRNAAGMKQIYRTVRHCASEHSNYQFILLTDREEMEEELLALPENVCLYRSGNLHDLLKICDLALATEGGSAVDDCIFAHLPVWKLTDRMLRRLTSRKLDKEIQDRLANLAYLKEQQRQLCFIYEQENLKVDQLARQLIANLKQKNRK